MWDFTFASTMHSCVPGGKVSSGTWLTTSPVHAGVIFWKHKLSWLAFLAPWAEAVPVAVPACCGRSALS